MDTVNIDIDNIIERVWSVMVLRNFLKMIFCF